MIDDTITDGTLIGIKIYLSIAETSQPHFQTYRKALVAAADRAGIRAIFEEGRNIAVGPNEKIEKCTKAVLFPLNKRAVHNKDAMRHLNSIVFELLKLKKVYIQHVEGARVVKVTTEETGYEIVTLEQAKAS